jgi:hypothetical protein
MFLLNVRMHMRVCVRGHCVDVFGRIMLNLCSRSTSLSYIPSVAGRTPSRVVHSVYIDFNDHTFAALGFDDRFVVRWSTNIEIKMAGTYAFQTCSDDGSNLYVSNQRVVNNDGLHGTYCREGSIYLGAGMIAITVNFFENGGGAVCYVKWKGPDTGETWQYTKPGRNEPDQDDKDARCYADRYSDLKNAFGYNTGSLFQHFRHYGMKEGRLFSCAEGAITVSYINCACRNMHQASWRTSKDLDVCCSYGALNADVIHDACCTV